MIGDCGFRAVFSVATLITGLLIGVGGSARADSIALSVSGMVTSSDVNGVTVGAGSYTAQQLTAVGSAVGTVTADGLSHFSDVCREA